jgi:hypothetical protein
MNRDGIVEIDTVLNDRQFNAQYYEIEDKLNGLVEEYRILSQQEPFEGQEVELKKMATQIQKYNKQLTEMKQNTNDVSDNLGGVSKGFKSSLKNLKLFALGLIGLRSAYSLAQRSASAYLSQDTELSNKLSSIWFGLGAFLKPLLEWLANAMAKLVGYINVFVKALTGRDFIKEANDRVKAINKQNKAQEKLNKTTASFDEIDVLSSNKNNKQDEDNVGFDEPELNEKVVKKLQDLAQVLKDNKDLIKEVGDYLLWAFVGACGVKVLDGIARMLGIGGSGGLLGLSKTLKEIIGFGAIAITFYVAGNIMKDLIEIGNKIEEISNNMAEIRGEFYADPTQSWESKVQTQRVNATAIRNGAAPTQLRNNVKTSKQLIQSLTEELKNTELTAEQRQTILDTINDQLALNREEIDTLKHNGYETEELEKIQAEVLNMRKQAMKDLGGQYAEQVAKEDQLNQKIGEFGTKVQGAVSYLSDGDRVSNDIKSKISDWTGGVGNFVTNVGNAISKIKGLKQETKETQENVDGIQNSSSKTTGFFETLRQKMFSTKEDTKGTYSWLDIINRFKIGDKSFKVNADTKSAQDKLKDLMFGWMPEKTKKLLRGWGFTFLAKGGIVHQPGSGVPIGSNIIAGEGRDAEAVLPLNDVTLGALGEQISKYITANFVVNNYMDNRKINSIQTTAQNRTDIMRNGG